MIVSHEHRFIFVKTRKTAGTSVEVFLEPMCGEHDVVTPVSPRYQDEETVRHRPRNHDGFRNHATAASIKAQVGDSTWDDYFKFTIERNPWDKMISMYWWRKYQYELADNFADFCRKAIAQPNNVYTCPSDYHFYTIDGELCVDRVIQFDSLLDDFAGVCGTLGLGEVTSLPRAKSRIRKEKRHYSEYYDEALRDLVHARFRPEIELFGYEFAAEPVSE